MRLAFLMIAISAVWAVASAQKAAQKKAASKHATRPAVIRLGQTDEEVRRVLGAHTRAGGVYSRQTSGGEVEIEVEYYDDTSRSHFHPTERVARFTFTFDQDLPLRSALNAIQEIRTICARGCAVAGMSLKGEATVIVEAIVPPSDMDKTEEALVMERLKSNWRIGCEVKLRSRETTYETAPVESITVDFVSIDFAKHQVEEDRAMVAKYPSYGRGRSESTITQLDPWKPALP